MTSAKTKEAKIREKKADFGFFAETEKAFNEFCKAADEFIAKMKKNEEELKRIRKMK